MIDIPKLIVELERAGDGWGDGWGDRNYSPSHYTDLCRRSALALREQQGSDPEVLRRLGLLLIELGRKLTGESHA